MLRSRVMAVRPLQKRAGYGMRCVRARGQNKYSGTGHL